MTSNANTTRISTISSSLEYCSTGLGFQDGNTPDATGISVSYHNIHYQVRQKSNRMQLCRSKMTKKILKGVSGFFPSGLNAIMGPTGSGKTSLMDVLAQRKDPSGMKQGHVLLDGEPAPKDIRLISGYVVQDDVVMGTLTVRENLAFSANLRLDAKTFSVQSRKESVNHVLKLLGLESCADSRVGNEFIRGVSGGERKRVHIGMEMVLDPPILFLDEPTSGLDAHTANTLANILHRIANEGKNVIMTIHQPRHSIFSLFNRLVLLNEGETVYHGPCKNVVSYFADIGFSCPQYQNPADFLLDVMGGDVKQEKCVLVNADRNQFKNGLEIRNADDEGQRRKTVIDVEKQECVRVGEMLVEVFKKSSLAQEESKILAFFQPQCDHPVGETKLSENHLQYETNYANGCFQQLKVVLQRNIRNTVRNPMVFLLQVTALVANGIFLGLAYFQSDASFATGMQNRSGITLFLVAVQVMTNHWALQVFINDRKHFVHESASGYYRVSVYFFGQVLADIIPNRFIPTLLLSVIVYFLFGFQMELEKFLFFLLSLLVTNLSATFLAFLVSAALGDFSVANAILASVGSVMILFGGLLINLKTLPTWLWWMKFLSIYYYASRAIVSNEMTGMVFIDNASHPGFDPCSSQPCISSVTGSPIKYCTTGEQYMETQGISYSDWDRWSNIVALAGMCVIFLLLAYIALRRISKYK